MMIQMCQCIDGSVCKCPWHQNKRHSEGGDAVLYMLLASSEDGL